MTISERYKILSINRKKNSFKRLYIIIIFLFAISFTFSCYSETQQVNVIADVAKWKIKINNYEINENLPTNVINLIYENNSNENVILPGQTGYFDIDIDPTGTEVSIEYQLIINLDNMPNDMQLTGYTLNPLENDIKENMPSNNTITGNIALENGEALNSSYKKTYRIFWEWDGTETLVKDNYNIDVDAKVKQII